MCKLVYRSIKNIAKPEYYLRYFTSINHQINRPTSILIHANKLIKQQFNIVKQIISKLGVCSLSANQIGSQYSYFVCLHENKLINNKWKKYKSDSKDYQIIINPQIIKSSLEQTELQEECCSFPGLKFKIKRPKIVVIHYKNQKNQQKEIQLDGFMSKVWQHEISQLNGNSVIKQSICHGQINILQQYIETLKKKHFFEQQKQKYKLAKLENKMTNNQYNKLISQAIYSVIEPIVKGLKN